MLFLGLLTYSAFALDSSSLDPNSQIANPLNTIKAAYSQLGASFEITQSTFIKKTKHCEIQKVELNGIDPFHKQKQKMSFIRYVPTAAERYFSEVLIFPSMRYPNRGATALEKKYASHLCKNYIATNVIHDWDGYFNPENLSLVSHDEMTMRLFNVGKTIINYIQKPVHLLGISGGAIYAPMILSLDDRAKGGVFIVGGAPLSKILADSKQKAIKLQREQRIKNFQIYEHFSYLKTLNQSISISPEMLVDTSKKNNVLLIIGSKDKTVPYRYQNELWQVWEKPKKYTFNAGHMMTILNSYFFKHGKIEAFIENNVVKDERAFSQP